MSGKAIIGSTATLRPAVVAISNSNAIVDIAAAHCWVRDEWVIPASSANQDLRIHFAGRVHVRPYVPSTLIPAADPDWT